MVINEGTSKSTISFKRKFTSEKTANPIEIPVIFADMNISKLSPVSQSSVSSSPELSLNTIVSSRWTSTSEKGGLPRKKFGLTPSQ